MPNPFVKDNWDWPFIVYAGTVLLRRSEDEVMRMTPRKFNALLKVHSFIEQQKAGARSKGNAQQQTVGFIDNIPGW